ncbi:hypothetical protein D3C84_1181690 [compost metagenome]
MFFVEGCQFGVLIAQRLVLRVDKVLGDAMHFGFGQGGLAATQVSHLGFDLLGEHFRRQGLDQDLDPRLVFVVATAVAVVYP